ncbi:MAG TPA: hypothetical protein PKE21_14040 [Flavobacteriales bacterium]|nr:hypothetical protein [Flavobacteriales bacterium]HMR28599.1 hypothetical protein [Flavobacteriales bacterium]
MNRALLVIPLTLTLMAHPGSAGQAVPPAAYASFTFGISLATSLNSQLLSCFVVKVFEGEVIGTEPVTRDQFLQQVRGLVPSKANPQSADLFAEHGVDACQVQLAEDGRRIVPYCEVLDDLWKLRFWEYPLHVQDGQRVGKGWAEQPLNPSPRQMLLLSNYGLRHPTDLCHGEAMFRLLRDVSDPEWVDNYRKGL